MASPYAPIATSNVAALAFALMELGPVSSFGDDSDQARMAAQFYPEALEAVLEGTDWSFAGMVAELPEAELPALASDADLPHVYALPPDVLRLRRVGDGRVRWRADRKVLRADQAGTLRIRYTARVVDETRMPATVRQVIAHKLALSMAPLWLGSQTKRDQLMRAHDQMLAEARRLDADQAAPQPYYDPNDPSDWVARALR